MWIELLLSGAWCWTLDPHLGIMANRDVGWIMDSKAALSAECQVTRVRHRADEIFLLMMGGRIIAMQSGFGMLESAFARPMNSANVMMKNLMDMFFGCIAFFLFGYGLAFDNLKGPYTDNFDFGFWFIHFSYATTAATIDSGALVGRVSFIPYLSLSFFITGVVYPVTVRWVWSEVGFLNKMGYIDFAGSSVVHLTGATCAFITICVCGPRIGRFPGYRAWRGIWRTIFVERNDSEWYRGPLTEVERIVFQPIKLCHNPVQLLFGVFLLLVGFLAFNPASTFSTTLGHDLIASRATVTTLLSSAGGAVASFIHAIVTTRSLVIKVPNFVGAVIGSMVSSCACCHVVPPLLALFVGFIGGLIALAAQDLLTYLQYDDPVGAVSAHGPPGAWGTICVALFAKPHCQSDVRGLVFGGGAEAMEMLGTQLTGLCVIIGWAAGTSYVATVLLDLFCGFRCNRATELIGLDYTEHHYDDGSFQSDPNKAMVMNEAPVRDCLVERVKETLSPSKEYVVQEAREPVATPPPPPPPPPKPNIVVVDSGLSSEDPVLVVEALKRTVTSMQEQAAAETESTKQTISDLQDQIALLSGGMRRRNLHGDVGVFGEMRASAAYESKENLQEKLREEAANSHHGSGGHVGHGRRVPHLSVPHLGRSRSNEKMDGPIPSETGEVAAQQVGRGEETGYSSI